MQHVEHAQIHQTDYMSGMGNGHTLEISGKSFSQGKKKASETLEKCLTDKSKYSPGRFSRHSIYSKEG